MVDREATYSFGDLAHFDVVETVTTLTCVSNPVGGNLISTGVWTGYRVADLLAAAGVHADADMVLSTSIDGFTAGTPVQALTDGREALLAVGLNGQPLPRSMATRPGWWCPGSTDMCRPPSGSSTWS